MTTKITAQNLIFSTLRENLGDQFGDYKFPPPIFEFMKGEFISFLPHEMRLIVQFPVLDWYMNPYQFMQGGMIAAAVDNTLGPLSVLVAPPNVTRHLEMTYSKPVTLEMRTIVVEGRLLSREGHWLIFAADVREPGGVRLARAKARHWIFDKDL